MRCNEDRLARPAKDRSFPVSLGDAVRLIKDCRFCAPRDRARLDIVLQNPRLENDLGWCVAGFYPADALVICSVPIEYSRARAKAVLLAALREFTAVSPNVPPPFDSRIETSYWTYSGPLDRLSIVKRVRKAKHRTFRGGGRLLSNTSSLGSKSTEETVVRVLEAGKPVVLSNAQSPRRG